MALSLAQRTPSLKFGRDNVRRVLYLKNSSRPCLGVAEHSPVQHQFSRHCQRRFQSTIYNQYEQQAPRQRSILGRVFRFTLKWTTISSIAFFAGGYFALTYLPNRDAIRALYTTKPLTPAETLSAYKPPNDDPVLTEINNRILTCPIAQQMRTVPNIMEWRPHMRIPEVIRPTNLTGGTLSGRGRVAVPPLVFQDKEGKSAVALFYLGEQLCGHPDIIHGGLLATMLDEGLARCCFGALPNKMAVTANLSIDYRKPARANKYYVLRAETQKVEGRKAWVKGWIEEMVDQDVLAGNDGKQPVKIVEAQALFVEPRNARRMRRLYGTDT